MNPGAILCQLPQWDYAHAGFIISSLPEEIRHALTKTEMLLVQMLLYLCGLQARKSGKQSAYATPGQNYLAGWLCRSSRTVRRALSHLESLDLLSSRQRYPLRGQPQTNLYKLGGQLLALLTNIKWPKSLTNSHKDKKVRQRPKERSGPPISSRGGSNEGYRDSHRPADLSPPSVPEGDKPLTLEEAKHGFEAIKAKIREKLGR